ncbi:uncharacterized protein LOC124380928 isoform X2 [Silurus meridionalis]|uniref:uncharacterized protein LOC124380928 isoform X2 n=2 Tax=Silurus meridionalis TaxID=175797 RepID=UPI001EECB76A|nr:uncharacterized protein LOC124380928 isoform X2 [Silurus meridionalis]
MVLPSLSVFSVESPACVIKVLMSTQKDGGLRRSLSTPLLSLFLLILGFSMLSLQSRIGEAHDQQEMKDIKVNKSQQIISKDLQGLLQFPTNTAGWWHALRPHHNDIASKKPWFYNPRPLPLCESSGQVSVVFLSHTHGHRCHSERPPGSNLRLRCDITLCRWIFDGRGTNVSSQWNLASACMPINTVDSYTQNQFSNM